MTRLLQDSYSILLRKFVNFCLILKQLFPLFVNKGGLLLCFVCLALGAKAQNPSVNNAPKVAAPADTSRKDSVKAKPVGDVKSTVNYVARDSMRFDIEEKKVYLYGAADIDYGDISLNADVVEINWETNTLKANGTQDSTGKNIGTPVFKQGSDQYVAKTIKYNFKTKKGHISEIVTQQGEGYLHGETVKKGANDEMFVKHAQYTTCNLAHPHFYISASKIKMIPKDKLVSGPFNLVIEDVPTPLGFFMGIFPTPQSQSSGIIIPTYGESRDRGFFLRGGGYYWAVNDYIGIKALGEIYSKGGYGMSVASDYRKRYAYDGNFSLRYNYRKQGDENNEIFKDYWVEWSHRPQTRKSSSFSASVNAGSSTYNVNNSFSPTNFITSNFSSRISYNKTFTGTPFSLGINASQQQNVTVGNASSGAMNFDLPDISFNMMSVYPFRRGSGSGKQTWYDNINVSYAMSARNSISNKELAKPNAPFLILTDQQHPYFREDIVMSNTSLKELADRSRNGVSHRIPISTTFRLLNHINVSPSFNYEEKWYFKAMNFKNITRDGNDSINVDTTRGLSRVYNYSTSVGFNTRMYGTFYTRKSKKIEAIRHTLNPNIGFSYRPDFGRESFGFYQHVRVGDKTYVLDRFQGSLYGGASQGKSASMSFGLTNSIEVKMRAKADTSAKAGSPPPKGKKVSILDNLSIFGGYNFEATAFKLSPISMSAQTNILNKLSLSVSAILDPYVYQRDSANPRAAGTRIDKYAWNEKGKGLGQFSNFSANLNTSLNPEAMKPKTLAKTKLDPAMQSELDFINANRDMYVDFDVPWNVRIGYTFNYNKQGYAPSAITQSVMLNGDLSLTPKWKIIVNTGYDFKAKDLVYPNIAITRNLHCWEMLFNWTPTGSRGGTYTLDIRAKASILQDLKFSRRRTFYDG